MLGTIYDMVFSFLSATLALPLYLSGCAAGANIVSLDYATFQGSTTGALSTFLGMPFAAAPVGRLRFAPPRSPSKLHGIQNATAFGPGCIPQALVFNPNVSIPQPVLDPPDLSEDCLSINVFRPVNIPANAKLPVIFLIYGGGFAEGNSGIGNGAIAVVNRSIALGHPVVYVSANYRSNAFGFLFSKELKKEGSGNAGLQDQRFALQWVQKYISKFGGDPKKVITTGSSAGAISIGLHMAANNGNLQGLFCGAVLESGSPFLMGGVETAQPYYDQLVDLTGCSTSRDTLACLRRVPAEDFRAAVNKTPDLFGFSSVKVAWQPRVDGVLFKQEALTSIEQGRFAKIPFITGDDDDEGTLFAISSLNVTTNEQALGYIQFLSGTSDSQLSRIAQFYTNDQTQGSPFGTGDAFMISPQYKRIAAFTTDWVWQGPRRYLLERTRGVQKTWSYVYRKGKMSSILGTAHGTSSGEFSAAPKGNDFLINFAYNLDPTVPVNEDSKLPVEWPLWSSTPNGALLTFSDPQVTNITQDTFRAEALATLRDIFLAVARKNDAQERC